MSYWVAIYRFAWILLSALVLVGVICLFTPKCRSLREMQSKKGELEQENRRLEEDIKDLRTRQEKFNTDPAFVERIAKEDLGMVRTNEVVFKFVPAPGSGTEADNR